MIIPENIAKKYNKQYWYIAKYFYKIEEKYIIPPTSEQLFAASIQYYILKYDDYAKTRLYVLFQRPTFWNCFSPCRLYDFKTENDFKEHLNIIALFTPKLYPYEKYFLYVYKEFAPPIVQEYIMYFKDNNLMSVMNEMYKETLKIK